MPAPDLTHPSSINRIELLCRRRILAFLFCVAAAFAVYAPALSGGLIWDDIYLVGENPYFKSPVFGFEVFRHWLFFDSFSTYYRPLQNWSYIFDYWLWRGQPLGYHLTNLGLHALAGFLLYLLLRRLLPSLLARDAKTSSNHVAILSLLAALIWLVHPIHNAAVAYISGRADSLAACFALLAWLVALRAQDTLRAGKRLAWALVAVCAIVAALCSKEIALIWLALFASHLWWKGSGGVRAKAIATTAAVAALAIYAGLHALPAHRAPMEDAPPPPLEARGLLMLRALGDYTGLMLFPDKLHMERTVTDNGAYRSAAAWRTHTRGDWLSVIGLLALLGTGWLCRWRAPGRTVRLAGAIWFAIAFLPISNLFPLNAEVAEHWIYLASIGLILLAAGTTLALPVPAQRWAFAVSVAAIFALGARTAVRSGDWVDAETFCKRTIESGGITPRILSTLASIYARRGEWEKQETVLRRTLEHFPEFTPARIQLGICLGKQGRKAEAEGLLNLAAPAADESARRYPRTWPAALNLARLRQDAGDPEAAQAILREARSRFPETWEIVRYQSELAPATALREVERFAAAHWWHLDSWLTLGRLRAAAENRDSAIAAFEHASRLDIYDGRPFAAVAEIEMGRHRHEAALTAQAAAITRDPQQPRHYLELGAILEQTGHQAEAAGALRKAQQLLAKAAAQAK